MLKRFLLLSLTLCSVMASAQLQYNFSRLSQTYTPLTGATSLNGGAAWDEEQYAMPLGFSFKLAGSPTNTLFLSMSLAGFGIPGIVTDTVGGSSGTEFTGILPADADLVDRGFATGGTTSLSPLSYMVSGTAPNRIFKVEISNAGFYLEGDSLGTLNDFVNVQVWLYETSNIIELRYGPSSVTHADFGYYALGDGPLIALANNFDISSGSGSIYYLSGNPSAPTTGSDPSNVTSLFTWPPNGTVYRFVPKTTAGIRTTGNLPISIYPTLATTALRIQYGSAAADYSIISSTGATVLTGTLHTGIQTIDINGISSGLYTLRIQSAEGSGIYRFVKQ